MARRAGLLQLRGGRLHRRVSPLPALVGLGSALGARAVARTVRELDGEKRQREEDERRRHRRHGLEARRGRVAAQGGQAVGCHEDAQGDERGADDGRRGALAAQAPPCVRAQGVEGAPGHGALLCGEEVERVAQGVKLAHVYHSSSSISEKSKTSSMVSPKYRAILWASGSDAVYLLTSMEVMVRRVVPTA